MHHWTLNTLIKMSPMLRTIEFPPEKKWMVKRLVEDYRHWHGVLSLLGAQLQACSSHAAPSLHALSEVCSMGA